MIVIHSSDKRTYLNARSQADALVGPAPSDGANATLEQIKPFSAYMEKVLAGELTQNIAIVEEQCRSYMVVQRRTDIFPKSAYRPAVADTDGESQDNQCGAVRTLGNQYIGDAETVGYVIHQRLYHQGKQTQALACRGTSDHLKWWQYKESWADPPVKK